MNFSLWFALNRKLWAGQRGAESHHKANLETHQYEAAGPGHPAHRRWVCQTSPSSTLTRQSCVFLHCEPCVWLQTMRWRWGSSTPPSCCRITSGSSWSVRRSTTATGRPRRAPRAPRSRWELVPWLQLRIRSLLFKISIAKRSESKLIHRLRQLMTEINQPCLIWLYFFHFKSLLITDLKTCSELVAIKLIINRT